MHFGFDLKFGLSIRALVCIFIQFMSMLLLCNWGHKSRFFFFFFRAMCITWHGTYVRDPLAQLFIY